MLKWISSSLLFLSISIGLSSQASSPAEQLTALWQSTKTYQAQFTQIVSNPATRAYHTSIGSIRWLQPNYFLWEITEPVRQTVLLKNDELWVYDYDLDQVTIQPFEPEHGNSIVWLFNATAAKLQQHFTIELSHEAGKTLFILRPVSDNELFAEIRLRFTKGQLDHLHMIDQIGQLTEIAFTNIQVNAPLPLTTFEVAIPATMDLIDAR